MGAYILRRLLLMVPTLFGIMLINFTLTQFVPGGPIEQILARIEGEGDVFRNIAGGGDAGQEQQLGGDERYVGARGLPPEFIAELEKQFGFDKPAYVRFFDMMGNYLRSRLRRELFPVDLGRRSGDREDAGVDHARLWSTLLAYLISIPLASARR